MKIKNCWNVEIESSRIISSKFRGGATGSFLTRGLFSRL